MFLPECCVKCKFVHPIGASIKLNCRRYPNEQNILKQPTEWCGEFKKHEDWTKHCVVLFDAQKEREAKVIKKEEQKKAVMAAAVTKAEDEKAAAEDKLALLKTVETPVHIGFNLTEETNDEPSADTEQSN